MRDRLSFSKWVNMFPRNPTQSRYKRFVTQPYSELTSRFDDSAKEFQGILNKALKTHYSEVWED